MVRTGGVADKAARKTYTFDMVSFGPVFYLAQILWIDINIAVHCF